MRESQIYIKKHLKNEKKWEYRVLTGRSLWPTLQLRDDTLVQISLPSKFPRNPTLLSLISGMQLYSMNQKKCEKMRFTLWFCE